MDLMSIRGDRSEEPKRARKGNRITEVKGISLL